MPTIIANTIPKMKQIINIILHMKLMPKSNVPNYRQYHPKVA